MPQIRVEYMSETRDASEWFNSVAEAQDWLDNISEDDYNDCDEDAFVEPLRFVAYEETRKKFGLSNQSPVFESELAHHLANGYKVTYEGKTGVTLEKE